ncbi:DUF4123 domain-containing protein [Paraburkholderia sp. LEh10]|uniref:DUF4123 domain-containing protein n=1 Tax=Paraburkholderia sp. LEh10 TaxID=2821353 RepID=UPI001AE62C4C|nr:DUF4123 domain-containing protein [Paraburkholderia sp. LEh10]MBP0588351.1 DUF4123 domain-containing protein [Paraburkholderia sp. LEh10]
MQKNLATRPVQMFGLVDGAASPDSIQPLLEQSGAPFVSVYEGLPEEQAGAASLFLVRIDNPQASWARELDAIDLHTPCLVLVWSRVDLPELASHLRAFLFADIGDGVTAMVRYFDPRNTGVVLRVWGEQLSNLFMAPLEQIGYRGRHEQWLTSRNRSRETGRTSRSVVIELAQQDVDVLTEHAEPDELMASLTDLGHIDEVRPYRERFLDLEPRYKRAIGWGLVEARDRLGYCEYSYRYGIGFDTNAAVRDALDARRRNADTFENAMNSVPVRVWRAMKRELPAQPSMTV